MERKRADYMHKFPAKATFAQERQPAQVRGEAASLIIYGATVMRRHLISFRGRDIVLRFNKAMALFGSPLEGEELCQARERTAMLQEVVLEKLARRGTALHVDTETHGEEGLQLLAELLGFLESGGSVGGDQVQGLERLLIKVRRLGLDHFDRHDAQGPDIDLGAVLLLLHNLGSHPVWRANHSGTLRLRLRKLGTEAKISCARNQSAFGSERVGRERES